MNMVRMTVSKKRLWGRALNFHHRAKSKPDEQAVYPLVEPRAWTRILQARLTILLRYAHFEGNYCSNLLYLYLVIQKYVSGAIIHSTNKVLLGLPAMYAFS